MSDEYQGSVIPAKADSGLACLIMQARVHRVSFASRITQPPETFDHPSGGGHGCGSALRYLQAGAASFGRPYLPDLSLRLVLVAAGSHGQRLPDHRLIMLVERGEGLNSIVQNGIKV